MIQAMQKLFLNSGEENFCTAQIINCLLFPILLFFSRFFAVKCQNKQKIGNADCSQTHMEIYLSFCQHLRSVVYVAA